MRAAFGPEEIGRLVRGRVDRRFSTSLRLPEILELRDQGLSYSKIGRRLGLTKRQVEHAVAGWRRREGA